MEQIQLPKSIYHYCSLPSFLSIVQNRSLRLTDISKSNDSLELHWIVKKYNDICNRHISENYNPELVTFVFQPNLLPPMLLDGSYVRCYATCFSQEEDLLSQWRGYAQDGTGVSIGIDRQKLLDIVTSHKVKYDQFTTPELVQVSYDNEEANQFAQNQFSSAIDKSGYNFDSIIQGASNTICQGYKYKNSAFIEELEWRLAYLQFPFFVDQNLTPDLISADDELSVSEVGFFVANGNLKTYVDFNFIDFPQIVNEIIIGPKSQITEIDIRFLLRENRYLSNLYDPTIVVKKSAASYR